MQAKNWHIEKNMKDLEHGQIINTITTHTVILATFVITGIFSDILPAKERVAIISSISLVGLFMINRLHKQLKSKINEIKMLKN